MWLRDCAAFARVHGLSRKQARQFECTAEHLLPRSAGGTLRLDNVAAACRCCNWRRGRLPVLIAPEAFRRHVQERCKVGKWHSTLPARPHKDHR
ncbi:HNH endonuclease [Lysobacter panacisoli]